MTKPGEKDILSGNALFGPGSIDLDVFEQWIEWLLTERIPELAPDRYIYRIYVWSVSRTIWFEVEFV